MVAALWVAVAAVVVVVRSLAEATAMTIGSGILIVEGTRGVPTSHGSTEQMSRSEKQRFSLDLCFFGNPNNLN